jgi:Tol biopolymer transport system component
MSRLAVLVLALAAVAGAAAMPAAASSHHHPMNGQISFTRWDPALHQDVVYTINPDGSHEQSLVTGAESGHWAPDGSRLWVILDSDGSQRLLNPDNGSYTVLPNPYPDLFLPCSVWSPDGSRLACEGFGEAAGTSGVYTVRSSDGSGLAQVSSGGDDDCPGDYSPNGRRIVFLRSSFETGAVGLFVVDVDGSSLHQITPPGMRLDFSCGSWSPNGNEILFSGKFSDREPSSIFVVHANGTGLRRIPIGTGNDSSASLESPSWSPDGNRIIFTLFHGAGATFAGDLFTANEDGTGLLQVTSGGEAEGLVDWGTHRLR